MNDTDTISAPDRPKHSGAERSKLPTTGRLQDLAAPPLQGLEPSQHRRRHRKPTWLNLTLAVVAILWLAVMWAILEIMLLEV